MLIKYFFKTENDEMCYTLDHQLEIAKDENLKKVELFEALPEEVAGMFWCKAVNECTEEGYCGKQCEDYEPKNKKSGICRHKCNTFYVPGKKITFEIN